MLYRPSLDIARRSIVIQNPVCRIRWNLDTNVVLSHVQAGTGGETPSLPTGGPRFETRMGGFNTEVTYFRFRSQNSEIAKYRDWVSRVQADMHEWFESAQPAA